ncbi:pyridoxal phosphate-dependent transferase [Halteromyces radiatus]|uniref:pyridoxal phosphate-dependent transferase n=1 Tax=Halteromyces radiatus TaxID=101107 RepID=UPI00221FD096|nr:pyridoxal phosphate-dependent transferase [Halteromyces radiatus]KAI8089657.1 pyridoxal phosphate-dependent transferase [Halteromyces radiatus]
MRSSIQLQLASIGRSLSMRSALGFNLHTIRWSSSLPTAVKEITHPDANVSKSTRDKITRFNQYTVTTYGRPDIVLDRGKGCYVYDSEGREYLDFTAGIAVVGLGHSDDGVAKVISEQAQKLIHTSNLYHNEHAGPLAEQLVETTNRYNTTSWASKVFLSNSGTEANEGALKFARKWGKHASVSTPEKKIKFVSFTNAFHGRSMGALSATYNPKYQAPFAPLIPGFVTAPYNDVDAVKLIDDDTCGVIVEPIQGEGGVRPATEQFLKALRQRCNETDTLLIYDEIQCGLGRTGKFWGHQHFSEECQPDILTMAKPLANGVPIGAIMTSEKVGNMIQLGDHGTTFGGNPLASAVARHVVGRLSDETFLNTVEKTGQALKQDLKALQEKYSEVIKEVRGQGLLLGIEFNKDPAPIVKLARERGLLLVTAGCNTVRIVPPLIVTREQTQQGIARLAGAIEAFAAL